MSLPTPELLVAIMCLCPKRAGEIPYKQPCGQPVCTLWTTNVHLAENQCAPCGQPVCTLWTTNVHPVDNQCAPCGQRVCTLQTTSVHKCGHRHHFFGKALPTFGRFGNIGGRPVLMLHCLHHLFNLVGNPNTLNTLFPCGPSSRTLTRRISVISALNWLLHSLISVSLNLELNYSITQCRVSNILPNIGIFP